MSHASIIQTLPAKLLQPTSIAIFASIGIHALMLGVALPSLLMFSSEQQMTARTVRILELTPAEQNRLPDFSVPPPPSNVPPFPNTPIFNPIKALPLPPFPNFKTFPLPPVRVTLPPPPPFTARNSPTESEKPINRLPTFPSVPSPIPPRELINSQREEIAANSDTESNSPPTPPTNADIVAQRQQKLVARIRQRRESLQADKTNTTNEEATKNYVNWLVAMEADKPKELNITGTYPKDACLRKLQGTTAYGVLVDAEGKVTNLQLVKSAGYPILNQQAQKDIESHSFENQTDQPKPYFVNVNFEYDAEICPSLAVTRRESNRGEAAKTGAGDELETPVTEGSDSQVEETENNPVTDESNNQVGETENNPVTDESNNQVGETQENRVPEKPDNQVIKPQKNPVTDESDNQVVEPQENSATEKPDKEVGETENNPVTSESDNQVVEPQENPTTEKPDKEVGETENNPVTSESDNQVVEPQKNPATEKPDNEVGETENNPVTGESDNQVVKPQENPVPEESDSQAVDTQKPRN